MSVLFALYLCALGCLLQSCGCVVATNTSCTNNTSTYTLRADFDQSGASCVRSSLDQYETCKNLPVYLESFNNGSYTTSECVQFVLEPGLYILSKTTTLLYSVVFSSTESQNVSIRCLNSIAPITREFYFKSLAFIGSTNVVLEGIDFEGCNGPIRFDRLASVQISNCSFRCVDCLKYTVSIAYVCLFFLSSFTAIISAGATLLQPWT